MKTSISYSLFLFLFLLFSIACKKSKPTNSPKQTNKITKNDLCGNPHFDLVSSIRNGAKKLTGTSYSQANKTDCSGMFHQLINSFREACPNAILPTIKNARSTRDIANWYHKNGTFRIIRDPEKDSELIQPGAVMFYGYGTRAWDYDHKSITIETLIIRNVGINHVAVITDVKRKDGNVESYEIFHGRNPKHPAGITTSRRIYPNQPNLPIYGNWKEPWLAVANVLASKK